MPMTSAFPACGKRADSSPAASGASFSTIVIARATARTSPRNTFAASVSCATGMADHLT